MFSASSHKNQDFLINFVTYTMHPFQKSNLQYLFLPKTMAFDGRTDGDRNQNNAKHSKMHYSIFELFPWLNHQPLKQRKFCCFLPRYRIFYFILLEVMWISDCQLHLIEVNGQYFVNIWMTQPKNRQSLPTKPEARTVLQAFISIMKLGHHSKMWENHPS